MAFNIDLLAAEGEPVAQPGEFFLLKRGDISCSVHVAGSSKLKGKGFMYLSTKRIVFVCIPAHKYKFQSFEAPLSDIINEKFNQPIFGANYLSGVATGSRLPNPAKFKLAFNSGGVGTFLRLFFTMMEKFRRFNTAQQQVFMESVQNGKFVQANQAYFDPRDPSVVYVTQPAFATTPTATPPAAAAAAAAPTAGTDGKGAYMYSAIPPPTAAAAPATAVAAPAPTATPMATVHAQSKSYGAATL